MYQDKISAAVAVFPPKLLVALHLISKEIRQEISTIIIILQLFKVKTNLFQIFK